MGRDPPAGGAEYAYFAGGGMSWAAPYVAGLYALACQVKPEVTFEGRPGPGDGGLQGFRPRVPRHPAHGHGNHPDALALRQGFIQGREAVPADHQEYGDRLRFYQEYHTAAQGPASAHGPAVASIALGETGGSAP